MAAAAMSIAVHSPVFPKTSIFFNHSLQIFTASSVRITMNATLPSLRHPVIRAAPQSRRHAHMVVEEDIDALLKILPCDLHESLLQESKKVGRIESVTLGGTEAKARNSEKTVLERKAPPTFHFVDEMRGRHR